MKQDKGITLVALIVFMIIIVLLSAIVISLAVGDNGIVVKSDDIKTKNLREQTLELLKNEVKVCFDEFGEFDQEEAVNNIIQNYSDKIEDIILFQDKKIAITIINQVEFKYIIDENGSVEAVSNYEEQEIGNIISNKIKSHNKIKSNYYKNLVSNKY